MSKVAIVTGSARGIGYATACKLCENGYLTVFSDVRPEQEMAAFVEELHQKGWAGGLYPLRYQPKRGSRAVGAKPCWNATDGWICMSTTPV